MTAVNDGVHSHMGIDNNHVVHNWVKANAAARIAAIYETTDIGKEVYQLDTKKFWRIEDVVDGVATFAPIGGGETDLSGVELLSRKGAANGYAGLDSGGHVPVSQIPDAIIHTLKFKGTFDGSLITSSDEDLDGLTAIPAASSSNEGFFFVSTAPHTSFDIDYLVGDWVISLGTSWQKIDNTDAISSFNGRLGAVVLNDTDLSEVLSGLTPKTTLVDADTLAVLDSEASGALKITTLSNLLDWINANIAGGLPTVVADGQVLTSVGGFWASAVAYGRGYANYLSGYLSMSLGGDNNQTLTEAVGSVVMGSQALAKMPNEFVQSSGSFSTQGDAQRSVCVLRAKTTSTARKVLTADNSGSASASNVITLQNRESIVFYGSLTAVPKGTSGSGRSSWLVKGEAYRGANAAETVTNYWIFDNLYNGGAGTPDIAIYTTLGALVIGFTSTSAVNTSIVAELTVLRTINP